MPDHEAQRENGRGPFGSAGTAGSPDNSRVPICTPGTIGINDKAAADVNSTVQKRHSQLQINHRTFIESSRPLPGSGKFAIGFGNIRFVAFDFTNGLTPSTRQFTLEQRFIDYASIWEKRHSPLAIDPNKPAVSSPITKLGSPFWPIIDER